MRPLKASERFSKIPKIKRLSKWLLEIPIILVQKGECILPCKIILGSSLTLNPKVIILTQVL